MMPVSRETSEWYEQPVRCSTCGYPSDRPPQRQCRACHAADMRMRREGMVNVLLTPAEWADVKAARQARTAGRHARRSKETDR